MKTIFKGIKLNAPSHHLLLDIVEDLNNSGHTISYKLMGDDVELWYEDTRSEEAFTIAWMQANNFET